MMQARGQITLAHAIDGNALSGWAVLRSHHPTHIVSHFLHIIHHVFATTTSRLVLRLWRPWRLGGLRYCLAGQLVQRLS